MAPLSTPRSKAAGKYADPTVQIVVSERQEPFHVHLAILEKTAFFEVHGYPEFTQTSGATPTRGVATMSSPAPSDNTLTPEDDLPIKMELGFEDDAIGTSGAASTITTPISENLPMPVYTIQGLIYDPAAFAVIVKYLYNERPSTPLDRLEFRNLRKSYVLALQYRIDGLQDDIIDCFRNFHTAYNVEFDDLTWLRNRIGGDEEVVCKVPLVQYLIDQVTYEIHKQGYDKFARQNLGFEMFLTNGNRPLRKALFKAMAKISMARNPGDPAVGMNRWRVEDYPAYHRSNVAREATVDIIDVDE